MKLRNLLLTGIIMLSMSAFGAHQLYADRDGVKIPYGTKLELKMSHTVTTQNITEGDIFEAYLVRDIYVNNKLVLPSKTIFRGRISKVTHSRRLSRSAQMYIVLDHLVTTTGVQLPVNSGLASDFNYTLKDDGAITTGGNYFTAVRKDAKKSTKIVKRAINWGKNTGDNAQYVFVPLGAIGGGIGCAGATVYNTAADLFRKGDEVVLKKGVPFTILLLSTLDIPI